ncbi:nuclear transport factor 2 family protein [Nocardia sp. NBC_00508]|uniref:nuclear transport factor 2 family protein n=1 Tax=Nocardia sp. NBC_00508 TaxID=2975992 RepID=UPI002E816FC2|nr:nuclear transport factor 2 family protein [Nocardia sp. NBC_00508]WUD64558.1 nuclear transport factor 2 family protein [Nocardia sp. NBC_00508]
MTTVASRTELYAEVQQFYAEQMQRLDNRDIPGYAETFTEDAEFEHTPGIPPARTRAGIIADLIEFHKRFETDPMQRRHWFNMINLRPQEDGTIVSTAYCLVVKIRPNSKPEIAPSCVVHDVLVRVDGALLTRSRRVVHD